ncbi:MAG: flagellar motor switch protein FliG [Armatimonadota bacterium]|nr:flagellar motor switch protein FliG [Armatimonadota bacterium]
MSTVPPPEVGSLEGVATKPRSRSTTPPFPVTGRQKAAIFLVALGSELSAEVMKHLREDEIEELTYQIANLQRVSTEQRDLIFREALQILLAHHYVSQGGITYAQEVLERALGPQRAQEIIARLSAALQVSPFDDLRRMDPLQLVSLIQNEHPQTIALILAYLRPHQAAVVLSSLPAELQVDVAMRLAVMDRTTPEVVREVENALAQKVAALPAQEYTAVGGVKALVDIINNTDRGTEKTILEALEAQNPELAQEVKKLMFVFEDLLNLDDRAIQQVLRAVDSKDLALAMKGASPELRQKIFSNMSQRAAEMLKEDMEFMGPVRRRDVEEAQQRIVNVVRKLEESGDIVIARGGAEELVI